MLALKKLFTDGWVFQHDVKNLLAGFAVPGKTVSVSLTQNGEEVFKGMKAADRNGSWSIPIPPFKGSLDPFTLHVSCKNEEITVNDIYSGELFHISGQSNMELPMRRTKDPFGDNAPFKDYPYIREYRTEISCCFDPSARSEEFAGGIWKKAVGEDILDMSAVGYYFAVEIYERLHIPVGLMNTSAGGASIESFMPYDMLKKYEIHDEFLKEAAVGGYLESKSAEDLKREEKWTEALGTEDFGLEPTPEMKDCVVPCSTDDIEELRGFSGRVYFFRVFMLPDSFPSDNAELILGTVTDSGAVYLNGAKIGETENMYPPRYYPIEKGLLRNGINTIAVRVDIKYGKGGFAKGKRYCIRSGNRIIELSGNWKYAIAAKASALEPSVFFQSMPMALFSDMFSPAMRIRYKALVWYQGETNCGRADLYKRMFSDLVSYYRSESGYDIPVIYTQLCGYDGMLGKDDPSDSWAKFRQAQLDCLDVRRTAMAVTVDLGEYNDLHPKNKKEVGRRLAYCAGGLLYGDETIFVKCKSAIRDDENIILSFNGNVYLKNIEYSEFEAVFEDGIYRCSLGEKELCGNSVTLKCAHAGNPKFVRYAWKNSPKILNLFDLRLVPVSPFEVEVK